MPNATMIREANFAYPYSERDQFYSPRTVQLLVIVSFLIVLGLVLLPFLLQQLEQGEYQERVEITTVTDARRLLVQQAAPLLERKATLDSIKADLEARIAMRRNIEAVDYAVDRLLLHVAELVPEGIVLTYLEMRPSGRTQAGRPGLSGLEAELPEELRTASILTLEGTARNSMTLGDFYRSLQNSPLFYNPEQSFNILGSGLSFRITTRLVGSGVALETGGSR
jgi:Tfp pilus assembly protein PilN